MIALPQIATVLASVGVLVTAGLAFVFLRDPVRGMVLTDHHAANLPQVMTDRYVALFALALGAVIYGDMAVIAFLFAVFSFLGFADAAIYARAKRPISKHMAAGVASLIVSAAACLALSSGVTV
jgi:hypothetical protein